MELIEQIAHFIETGDGEFGDLALAVFRHQFDHCALYQRFCRQLGRTPESVSYWREIPAVPTDVFREFDLTTFPPEEATITFRTSGTANPSRGRHHFRSTRLYDLAIQHTFTRALGIVGKRSTFRILAPSPSDAADSSLSYMLGRVVEWHGNDRSRFYWRDGLLDCAAAARDLRQDIAQGRPVVLLGTAFAFVHFLDQYAEELFILPPGSAVMETGGFKGQQRSINRDDLYTLFETHFGLERARCVSEYGMTELSSQCYSTPDTTFYLPPRWLRVRVIDPSSGAEVSVGSEGVIQFFDLANVESIAAIATSDRGRRGQVGFELLGRAPRAVLRGCSTTIEE